MAGPSSWGESKGWPLMFPGISKVNVLASKDKEIKGLTLKVN
jgi:hypothetical protein